MTTATPNTMKPSHRLPPVEGVIPTPEQETKMTTTVQQPTDTITPQQQEAIDRLNALEPGYSVNNGVAWYENAGPGLWSIDADSKSAEVHTSLEIVLAATKALDVDRASRSIALPAKALEPNLARFTALAGDQVAPWVFDADAADPHWTGTCPAWCAVEKHTVDDTYGADSHRSRPITVLYTGRNWTYSNGRIGVAHYEVSLDMSTGSAGGGAWVQLAQEAGRSDGSVDMPAARLRPREARALANALLAAAALADPDSDFEGAVR